MLQVSDRGVLYPELDGKMSSTPVLTERLVRGMLAQAHVDT